MILYFIYQIQTSVTTSESGSPDHHGRRRQRADIFMVLQSQLIHFNVSVFDIFSISLMLNLNDGSDFVIFLFDNSFSEVWVYELVSKRKLSEKNT